ncbi:hypothetical protein PABG_04534 [Paracoccidioides brasiliensis Pb03]|nr:hypothetical protein PABG_04534 [Paracoccidioides brasiliensis Pb03]
MSVGLEGKSTRRIVMDHTNFFNTSSQTLRSLAPTLLFDPAASYISEMVSSTDSEQLQHSKFSQSDGGPPDCMVGILVPPLTFPKSSYSGHEPPQPKFTEKEAVETLLKSGVDTQTYAENDFVSLELDNFVIYALPFASPAPHGMVSLDQIAGKLGRQAEKFFFDGVLKVPGRETAGMSMYLERVPFRLVSIGGYEDTEQHSVGKDIWIQSAYGEASGKRLWYQLGAPVAEYKEYHKTFSWIADLGKHLIDYLHHHKKVTFRHFKKDFSTWLKELHSEDPTFMHWFNENRSIDFRKPINAFSNFLQKQAWELGSSYCDHPFWDELGVTYDNLIPEQPQRAKGTIVTPYVYECFKTMEWANHINAVELDSQMSGKHQSRLAELGFIQKGRKFKTKTEPIIDGAMVTACPRDVVAIRRDQQTCWKGTEDLWYAVVQDIHPGKTKHARLSLIWLYRPSDTVCRDMNYPHNNELFLSDHCNCGDGVVDTSEIVKKLNVTFFAHKAEKGADFFVRQTYFSDDETFTSLKKDHFSCQCRQPPTTPNFEIGDTILFESVKESHPDQVNLEPAEILEFGESCQVKIRLLLRRSQYVGAKSTIYRPNELVYTNRTHVIHVNQIERRCQVRFYTEEQRQNGSIPAPYNRDGTGDAFYIIAQEAEEGSELVALQHPPAGFKQGFDSEEATFQKLRALNIFSGGGSFDRGLEEGGAIRNEWAVEWELAPMLTYRANQHDPERVKLFLGSVNDFLLRAFQGKSEDNNLVAKLGDVEFISAGSPCQGYSSVNSCKENEVSMRNSSMIASVASYVDFFRPKYAILENVIMMSNRSNKKNPLCQLLCAFVGMGYQLRILNLDAWSFGAPQSRSRLFIFIAVPGLQLPAHPPLTHSHLSKTTQKSLGDAPNGLPFGKRRWDIPVFDFLSVSKSLMDLPRIGRGKITPVAYPDHRTIRTESAANQRLLSSVPKTPRCQGLFEAVARGYIDLEKTQKRKLRKGQRAWSRIHPHLLMPTVTTFPSPFCKFTGRWLHWEEDRVMTVMEVRRAQGFPDDEVLIGSPAQQWKIVGNSVARQVALALGLVMREACVKNHDKKAHENNVMVTNGFQVVVERPKVESGIPTTEPTRESDDSLDTKAEATQNTLLPLGVVVLESKNTNENNIDNSPLKSPAVDLTEDTPPPQSLTPDVKRPENFIASILTPWLVRSEAVAVSEDDSSTLNTTSEGDNFSLHSQNVKRSLDHSFVTSGPELAQLPPKKRRLNDEAQGGSDEFWSEIT